jgi:hypothetical protein
MIVSAGVGTTSASRGVSTSLVESEAATFVSGGSGRHSRFVRLQRGQTQSLDLEHSCREISEGKTRHIIHTTWQDACARLMEPRVHRPPSRLALSKGRSLGGRL